ncbi:MAG: DNA-binding protein [Gammaproteobacteria bacterium]
MDEFSVELRRPVILNGIHDITTEPDLASRALILALQPIPDHARREESELWDEFEKKRPRIFGAVLDALSCALRRLPETKLDSLPRMADFARWVSAAEPGFGWDKGTFMAAYKGNIKAAVSLTLEASAVAQAVLSLMKDRHEWKGTATQLLAVLVTQVSERTARSQCGRKPRTSYRAN